MTLLAKLIGVYIVVMGSLFLLRPKTIRQFIAFWGKGKRLYVVGISRLLIGTVLLLAAPQCRRPWFVFILGILIILLLSMPYFILGEERLKAMFNRWDKRPAVVIRLMGLICLVIGALLIYSV
jgi:hypothetical protein